MTASLLFCVGEEHYGLDEFIVEAQRMGVSKRIPLTYIPDGLVPYESHVLLAHPQAIVRVTAEGRDLVDLAYALLEMDTIVADDIMALMDVEKEKIHGWTGDNLKAEDYVPLPMLTISRAISTLPTFFKTKLEKEYGIEYMMGVFGFAPFGRIEFVLPDGVDTLPEEHKDIQAYIDAGIVTPVHVTYMEDDNDTNE